MSGISGSGSGRHVASHARPGAMSQAKGKVKTAAAVTSVLAVSGGVATAFHLHQDGLRNSAEAASQDSNTNAAAAAANALAVRNGGNAANRDLQRPALGQSSTPGGPTSSAPTSAQNPTSATSSGTTPPAPTSTATTPAPTRTEAELPTQTSTSTPTPTKTTPTTTSPTTTSPTTPSSSSSSSGSSSDMGYNATPAQAKAMAEQIVPSGQFMCFADIIERESSWNIFATNPSSGAYGLGQALPGYKMASMGSAWRNSALIQIKWALSYMNGRYGSPCAAWTFWQNHNWY